MEVQGALDAALSRIELEVPKLKTGFRLPAVEALAVLWPGTENVVQQNERTGAVDSGDDLLE
jgi:hypothetical protein